MHLRTYYLLLEDLRVLQWIIDNPHATQFYCKITTILHQTQALKTRQGVISKIKDRSTGALGVSGQSVSFPECHGSCSHCHKSPVPAGGQWLSRRYQPVASELSRHSPPVSLLSVCSQARDVGTARVQRHQVAAAVVAGGRARYLRRPPPRSAGTRRSWRRLQQRPPLRQPLVLRVEAGRGPGRQVGQFARPQHPEMAPNARALPVSRQTERPAYSWSQGRTESHG